MRPECGCVLIACPSGIAALETTFLGRVLYVVIIGQPRSKVTPEALIAALEYECGNLPSKMKVEVIDLGLEVINSVIEPGEVFPDVIGIDLVLVGELRDHYVVGVESTLHHPLALEDLLLHFFESLLHASGVDGELIDMLPSTDKWLLHCTAWLRNPSAVPKVLTMSVPAPPLQPWKPDSDDENAHSPPRPLSPTDRGCTDFTVIMHVKEVIDLGPLLTEGLADEFLPYEGVDLTRRHTFATWRGKIDGTGPGPNGKG
ncbi:hypothetical protein D1007_46969 [Hordeum vulgare]|nr:hypothetical protein D1007_46969 [Hordeum vulgare]